jgi:hypothetical protein
VAAAATPSLLLWLDPHPGHLMRCSAHQPRISYMNINLLANGFPPSRE